MSDAEGEVADTRYEESGEDPDPAVSEVDVDITDEPDENILNQPNMENVGRTFFTFLEFANKRTKKSPDSDNFNLEGCLLFTYATVEVFGRCSPSGWNGIASDFGDSETITTGNSMNFPKFASIHTEMKNIQKKHGPSNPDRNSQIEDATFPGLTWWKPGRGISTWLKFGDTKSKTMSSEVFKAAKGFQRFFSGFVLQLYYAKEGNTLPEKIKADVGDIIYNCGLKGLTENPLLQYKLIIPYPGCKPYPYAIKFDAIHKFQRLSLRGYEKSYADLCHGHEPSHPEELLNEFLDDDLIVGDTLEKQASKVKAQILNLESNIRATIKDLELMKSQLEELKLKQSRIQEQVQIEKSNQSFIKNIRSNLPIADSDIFDYVANGLIDAVKVLNSRVQETHSSDKKSQFLNQLNRWLEVVKDDKFLTDSDSGTLDMDCSVPSAPKNVPEAPINDERITPVAVVGNVVNGTDLDTVHEISLQNSAQNPNVEESALLLNQGSQLEVDLLTDMHHVEPISQNCKKDNKSNNDKTGLPVNPNSLSDAKLAKSKKHTGKSKSSLSNQSKLSSYFVPETTAKTPRKKKQAEHKEKTQNPEQETYSLVSSDSEEDGHENPSQKRRRLLPDDIFTD